MRNELKEAREKIVGAIVKMNDALVIQVVPSLFLKHSLEDMAFKDLVALAIQLEIDTDALLTEVK